MFEAFSLTYSLPSRYLKIMKFLLFDIDGTLIDSAGAGKRSLNISFNEMFGKADAFEGMSLDGKTDPEILREGMTRYGIPYSDETTAQFFDTYLDHLKSQMPEATGHVKQGIREALEALRLEEQHIIGLLTGNIECGAQIKLANFGLQSYFEIGAFGSDEEDRNKLVPVAVDKLYRSRALAVDYSNCVVIGDTPRDIDCAKAYGALAIAVATGNYTVDALEKAGADMVFHDLSDTGAFLAALNTCP
jgi:phosphoglycolate phosphatase-like HAD superfamily hydrolase